MNPKRILVDPPRHPRPETLALPPQPRLGTLMSIHTSAYATVAAAGAQGIKVWRGLRPRLRMGFPGDGVSTWRKSPVASPQSAPGPAKAGLNLEVLCQQRLASAWLTAKQ